MVQKIINIFAGHNALGQTDDANNVIINMAQKINTQFKGDRSNPKQIGGRINEIYPAETANADARFKGIGADKYRIETPDLRGKGSLHSPDNVEYINGKINRTSQNKAIQNVKKAEVEFRRYNDKVKIAPSDTVDPICKRARRISQKFRFSDKPSRQKVAHQASHTEETLSDHWEGNFKEKKIIGKGKNLKDYHQDAKNAKRGKYVNKDADYYSPEFKLSGYRSAIGNSFLGQAFQEGAEAVISLNRKKKSPKEIITNFGKAGVGASISYTGAIGTGKALMKLGARNSAKFGGVIFQTTYSLGIDIVKVLKGQQSLKSLIKNTATHGALTGVAMLFPVGGIVLGFGNMVFSEYKKNDIHLQNRWNQILADSDSITLELREESQLQKSEFDLNVTQNFNKWKKVYLKTDGLPSKIDN